MEKRQLQLKDIKTNGDDFKTIFAIDDVLINEQKIKCIHYLGYAYISDGNFDTRCKFVEYTYFIVPLKIAMQTGIYETELMNGENYTQYIKDGSIEDILKSYNEYDNGQPPALITKSELNNNTPEGVYILID